LPLILDQLPSVRQVNIATRSVESAARFKSDIAPEVDRELCVFDSVPKAAGDADIVITSIGHPAEPPLTPEDLHDGILALPLDAEGAWTPESFRQADQLFADDVGAFLAGWHKRRPGEEQPHITANLASVIQGDHARRTTDERLMAANNGIASLDVSVGAHIFERARANGAGLRLR
jgi:ornithine cyclodeaminase/alanine dehydrogenase-like protein (mu-crystallin family)